MGKNVEGKQRKMGIPSDEFKRRIRRPVTLDRIRRYHEDTQKKFDLQTKLFMLKLQKLQKVSGLSARKFNPNEHMVIEGHMRHARDQTRADCERKQRQSKGTKIKCETTLTADQVKK